MRCGLLLKKAVLTLGLTWNRREYRGKVTALEGNLGSGPFLVLLEERRGFHYLLVGHRSTTKEVRESVVYLVWREDILLLSNRL